MINPQEIVPESVMPSYAFLASTPLYTANIAGHLRANRGVGVPYSDEMIENAAADLQAQADPDSDGTDGLEERYSSVIVRDFDGNPNALTEMDAMVAYLQMLGTLVDFSTFKAETSGR